MDYTILTSSAHTSHQNDVQKDIVEVPRGELPTQKLKVSVSIDKSYPQQTRAKVELWTPAGWTEVFTEVPETCKGKSAEDVSDQLIATALLVIQ